MDFIICNGLDCEKWALHTRSQVVKGEESKEESYYILIDYKDTTLYFFWNNMHTGIVRNMECPL